MSDKSIADLSVNEIKQLIEDNPSFVRRLAARLKDQELSMEDFFDHEEDDDGLPNVPPPHADADDETILDIQTDRARTRNQHAVERLRAVSRARREAEGIVDDPLPAQLDLFNADAILDYSLRDEVSGMVIPMYALKKQPDRGAFELTTSDGKLIKIYSRFLDEQLSENGTPREGEVVHGRATIFDKDLIIYSVSKINEAINRGLNAGPVIRFTANDFFTATRRKPGGKDYENMVDTLRRLRSTNVETNVFSKDGEITSIKGIINEGEVKRDANGRLEYIQVTLANWLFAAVRNRKILAINPEYFDLPPLERAIYAVARQYVGNEGTKPPMPLQKLKERIGAAPNSPLRNFLLTIQKVIEKDSIPDYRMTVTKDDGEYMVTFYNRDMKKLTKSIIKDKLNRK